MLNLRLVLSDSNRRSPTFLLALSFPHCQGLGWAIAWWFLSSRRRSCRLRQYAGWWVENPFCETGGYGMHTWYPKTHQNPVATVGTLCHGLAIGMFDSNHALNIPRPLNEETSLLDTTMINHGHHKTRKTFFWVLFQGHEDGNPQTLHSYKC